MQKITKVLLFNRCDNIRTGPGYGYIDYRFGGKNDVDWKIVEIYILEYVVSRGKIYIYA